MSLDKLPAEKESKTCHSVNSTDGYTINEQGWLNGVRHLCSPNYNQRPAGSRIELIVIHNISLPPGQFGTGCIEQFFCNQLDHNQHPFFDEIRGLEVSAHLLITRDGEIIQFVPFMERAWHAGKSQFAGRENCNDFSVGIELEGADNVPYTSQQYHQLVKVILSLQTNYPDIDAGNIVGHCDIAPGRKTDPGEAFDWEELHRLLKG